jgi:hypothetical protein
MHFTSTGKKQPKSVKSCVLFDSADGTIRHVHHVVTMEGAEENSTERIEQRARQLAKDLAVDGTNLHALHVDISSIKPGVKYKVDPSKRCLVALN